MQKNRIESIDSFRAIAILMVITFHFFSRWTTLYPYHNIYDFFGYGKFGVHFFFMISGFVIFFTLEKTLAFKQFWINRFIRLFPSMLFASVLTYLFFTLFDTYLLFPTSHSFKNIIVSLTFVQPDLISSLTRYQFDLDYISGSYWSLWVEIQFYLLASLLYFLCSKRFYSYFFLIATLLVTANFLLSHCYVDFWLVEKLKSLRSIFNLISALPFFCLGSIFFIFYKNNYEKQKNSIFIQIYFLVFVGFLFFNNYQDVKLLGLISLFILLFFFMIYHPKFISFLNTKFLNTIGISSYFLYLIHENIGVFLIHKNLLTLHSFSFLEPIIVILILIGISILFTRYIERYIISYLKALFKKTAIK
jgi:peptidoglycan/LPS O-acetylase OafA/YrhL